MYDDLIIDLVEYSLENDRKKLIKTIEVMCLAYRIEGKYELAEQLESILNNKK